MSTNAEPTDAETMNAMAVLDAECTRRGNGNIALRKAVAWLVREVAAMREGGR